MKRLQLSILRIIISVSLLSISVPSWAALQSLGTDSAGNQLIYDTDLDITWYDFTNAGDNLAGQNAWAQSLSVSFGSFTYEDWRLPNAPVPDSTCSIPSQSYGSNCTGSELGHLYYSELGNAWQDALPDTGIFQNLEVTGGYSFYWMDGPGVNGNQHVFNFSNTYDGSGFQSIFPASYASGKGIAVMDGRALVPEPISSTLFIAGGATFWFRRFMRRRLI